MSEEYLTKSHHSGSDSASDSRWHRGCDCVFELQGCQPQWWRKRRTRGSADQGAFSSQWTPPRQDRMVDLPRGKWEGWWWSSKGNVSCL